MTDGIKGWLIIICINQSDHDRSASNIVTQQFSMLVDVCLVTREIFFGDFIYTGIKCKQFEFLIAVNLIGFWSSSALPPIRVSIKM